MMLQIEISIKDEDPSPGSKRFVLEHANASKSEPESQGPSLS